MKKLLIIDDEESIVHIIKTYFSNNGYQVICARDALEGEEMLKEKPDIILLDVMMPGIDGIEFCRVIRERILCPIVFLSAKTEENSKLLGLASGGDDYLTKPFSIRELFARVEAHTRREGRPREHSTRIFFGSLWIDYSTRECGVHDRSLSFTKKEFNIIELLSANTGQVFTHDRIYEKVWGYDAEGDANTSVTEHIKRIRKKLAQHGGEDKIETVWGMGYKWRK